MSPLIQRDKKDGTNYKSTFTICPYIDTFSSTNPSCPIYTNGSIKLTILGYNASQPGTFEYRKGAGVWQSASNSGATAEVTGLDAGSYEIRYTSSGTGCQVLTQLYTLTNDVSGVPVAPTVSTPQKFCTGNSPTVANLTVLTGTNIKWYAASTGGSALLTSTALVNNVSYFASQTVGGCESVRTEVVVNLTAAPNAGTDGSLTICSGTVVTAAQLFAQLGGTPTAGGSWSPAFAGAGTYTYTVAATAPCTVAATSNVVVTAQAQPNAGTNGSLTICSGTVVTATQLFAQLGGTPTAGGSWSPAFAGAGTYTYTVAATAPCTVAATSNVVVTAQALPNAGTNGSLTICSGTLVTAAQLFAQLGGSTNSGW